MPKSKRWRCAKVPSTQRQRNTSPFVPLAGRRSKTSPASRKRSRRRPRCRRRVASQKAGPASDYAIAVLLSLMCDHAEDDAPRAIVTALKWQSLYRIAFTAARCGKLSEADAALKRAEELAHELP